MRIVGAIAISILASTGAWATDFAVVRRTVDVAASADHVWSVVGDYCALSKLLDLTCRYASGAGDVGTVRSLNGGQTMEPMIARTRYSYSYGQTVGAMTDFYYHGTLAVEPLGKNKSLLVYTLIYDQERMTPEVRAAQRARIEGRFQGAIDKGKMLAEAR